MSAETSEQLLFSQDFNDPIACPYSFYVLIKAVFIH
jgi:hypothetical protein